MISDAHGSKTPGDCMAVGRIAVPDKVVRCFIPREGIGDLAGDPLRCGISRHAERYQPPTLVPEDDQYEEQPEADCRHDQEVRGGDAGRMIAEESFPGLRRPSPPPRHILGNGRLSDFDTELQQLAMDARCAPEPVGQTPLEPLADRRESATSSASTIGSRSDATG